MFQGKLKFILGVLVVCVLVVVGIQTRVPTITDLTQGNGIEATWKQGVDRRFRVEIERSFLYSIDDVRLKYTRHVWPGADLANSASIIDIDPTDEIWEAKAGDLEVAPRTHSVFYQWEVDYTSGFSSGTVRTDELKFTIGCTVEDLNTQLRAQRDAFVDIYDVDDPKNDVELGPLGPFLSHGYASLENMGFGISSYPGGLATTAQDWPAGLTDTSFRPTVVLYRPHRIAEDDPDDAKREDYQAYANRVSEPNNPDLPYKLIGWVFGQIYKANHPPVFGCVPSKEWFIHEPGYHMHDGSMVLESVQENLVGERDDMPAFLPTIVAGARAGAPTAPIHFYHGRGWTLHIWLDPDDPTGLPTLSVDAPAPATHDPALGPYVPGLQSDNLFVYTEIWD